MAEVICFDQVVKRYRLGAERSNLRAANPFRRFDPGMTADSVTALDHVDLTVEQGEALGVIGDNGTGKSTLLKLIAGVIAPTSGTVSTRGRIASVIELGVGFHDDLTGMENLEFTGALLGMSRADVRRRRDAIVDFAGIGHAMDTPVKRYSSGMLARLGFAIATHVDADIVLVDEVLAVGDVDFQRLSLERLENLILDGVTTVFVSHNLAAVAHLCNRVAKLDRGRLVADDEPERVVLEYGGTMALVHAGLGRVPVRLKALRVRPQDFDPSQPFTIEADVEVERPMPRGRLRLALRPTAELVAAHGTDALSGMMDTMHLVDVAAPSTVLREEGTWQIRGHVERFPMFPGTYTFSLELLEDPHNEVLDVATALVHVPGVVAKREAAHLPISWDVDMAEAPGEP